MKKLCLTSLLVLFMTPALATEAGTSAENIITTYETEAQESIEDKPGIENVEEAKLNDQKNTHTEQLGDKTPTDAQQKASEEGTGQEEVKTNNETNTETKEDEEAAAPDADETDEEAKATEQSLENKMLGAVGIGATGIGGMQLAQGLAEQNADAEAEAAMKAYLATFTCEYGGGRIAGGTQNVELPGTNLLTPMIMEYKELAADLKSRKEALDMTPGIESEVVLDAAMAGLHNDVNTGKTGGAYTSLARALSGDANAAAAWDAQKEESAKQVKTGAIVAGVGAAGSLIGNVALNGELGEKIKDLKTKKASKKSEENAKDLKKKLTDAGMEKVDQLDLSKIDLSDADSVIKKLDFKKLKSAIEKKDSKIETDATVALDTADAKKFKETLAELFKSAEQE
ncbi:MAG: hypothetical protein J6R99_03820 [Alphaproteobacteria bacterium]|nr:hypothetical protein [Alphaproteobacteria bacterium]